MPYPRITSRAGGRAGSCDFWHTVDAMRFFALAALLMVTALSPLAAQDPVTDPGANRAPSVDESATRFPLRGIEIAGNQHFATEEIIRLSGLKIGDMVNQADFHRGLQRLNSAGVFEAIEFRYAPFEGGYKLTYTVQEFGELYPFRADGFDVPPEQIFQMLKEKVPLFGEMVPPTGAMVERIGDTLQEYWKSQGNDSEILGRLAPAGAEDEFEMLFQPEAAIETISFVKFENTGVLSPLELQRSFNQVAMGVPYSEARLKELLHYNVRPLYEEKARMEVEFCPCTAEPDEETKGTLVTVHVEQGEEYTFGTFTFPQRMPMTPEQMASVLKVKEGEPADMGKVRAGMSALEDTMKRNGYMKALARYEPQLNSGEKTVDVEVMLDPGAQYTMGRLTVTGLDVLTEPAIRKRWGLKPGEPFDGGYPTYYLERIRETLDNLSKTDSKATVNETNKTVDVELIFVGLSEQTKPGEILGP
jgi:outer membrane protein insertion porin family